MSKKGKTAQFKYFEPVGLNASLSRELSALNLDDSFDYFASKASPVLFLNSLDEEGLLALLKKVGLLDHLHSLGYSNILVEINLDENRTNYLRVYYEDTRPERLLIDLRVSESRFIPEKRFYSREKELMVLDMVVIEWLSAQRPGCNFTRDKPQLPGQSKPGLGCLRQLMDMMYHVGKDVVKDGFMDVPDHFHGAVMYSGKFKFFNPSHEAILKAMLRDLKQFSLADLSWGMITKTIINGSTGEPQIYDPSEQVFPVSERLITYFNSEQYREKFHAVYRKKSYTFDYELMVERREELLKAKKQKNI